jgi:hypothetical protein
VICKERFAFLDNGRSTEAGSVMTGAIEEKKVDDMDMEIEQQ